MQSLLHPIIGPKKVLEDLSGRVAVITGGAEGIGAEIAKAFASVGCQCVIVNRRKDQGQRTIDEIKAINPEAKVSWEGCDLGKLAEVENVFGKIAKELPRLDILVNNAGINVDQTGRDADDVDRHMGVNVISHFLVTRMLYPLLQKTAKMADPLPPRIVFESSEMHRTAPSNVHFGSLAEINDQSIGNTEVYGRTKLAQILLAKAVRDYVIKPAGDQIFTASVHPGTVNTQMQNSWVRGYPGVTGKLLSVAMKSVGRTPEQGAFSALYAATSNEILDKYESGVYLSDPGTSGKESAQACDPWLQRALWELCTRIVKLKVGGDNVLGDWDISERAWN